jgi:hypothetical protein
VSARSDLQLIDREFARFEVSGQVESLGEQRLQHLAQDTALTLLRCHERRRRWRQRARACLCVDGESLTHE